MRGQRCEGLLSGCVFKHCPLDGINAAMNKSFIYLPQRQIQTFQKYHKIRFFSCLDGKININLMSTLKK